MSTEMRALGRVLSFLVIGWIALLAIDAALGLGNIVAIMGFGEGGIPTTRWAYIGSWSGFDLDQKLLASVGAILNLVLWMPVALPLFGFVRSGSAGMLFNTANVVRLRIIAVGVVIQSLVPPIAVALTSMKVGAVLVYSLASSSPSWIGSLYIALIAAMLAEGVRHGSMLRDDVEATV